MTIKLMAILFVSGFVLISGMNYVSAQESSDLTDSHISQQVKINPIKVVHWGHN